MNISEKINLSNVHSTLQFISNGLSLLDSMAYMIEDDLCLKVEVLEFGDLLLSVSTLMDHDRFYVRYLLGDWELEDTLRMDNGRVWYIYRNIIVPENVLKIEIIKSKGIK